MHDGFTQPQRDFYQFFQTWKTKVASCNGCCYKRFGHSRNNYIINYDIPLDSLVYFHRIGQTARMGREGTTLTLVGYGKMAELNQTRALTKTAIDKMFSGSYVV